MVDYQHSLDRFRSSIVIFGRLAQRTSPLGEGLRSRLEVERSQTDGERVALRRISGKCRRFLEGGDRSAT